MSVFRVVSWLALAGSCLLAVSDDSQARAEKWKQRLLAPCCWSEAVAQHNSPVAAEIRTEIDQLFAAGVPDSEIEAKFVAKYGRRILTEPPGFQGVLLVVVPLVVLALGTVWVVIILRKWLRHNGSNTRDVQARA